MRGLRSGADGLHRSLRELNPANRLHRHDDEPGPRPRWRRHRSPRAEHVRGAGPSFQPGARGTSRDRFLGRLCARGRAPEDDLQQPVQVRDCRGGPRALRLRAHVPDAQRPSPDHDRDLPRGRASARVARRNGFSSMRKVRVLCFAVSLDGFAAGPDQSLENPLGVRGTELMEAFFATREFRKMHGEEGGETGIDNRMAERSFEGIGAFILGRNMFGPVRGPWPDESWKGWWGDEPPYHVPTFVLTHHARKPVEMKGGTVFHFVTGGIHEALDRAKAAAGAGDVRIGGGVSTVRQYLGERLIDEVHLVVRPVLMGTGEHLYRDLDLHALGYECAESVVGERATHVFLRKRA